MYICIFKTMYMYSCCDLGCVDIPKYFKGPLTSSDDLAAVQRDTRCTTASGRGANFLPSQLPGQKLLQNMQIQGHVTHTPRGGDTADCPAASHTTTPEQGERHAQSSRARAP